MAIFIALHSSKDDIGDLSTATEIIEVFSVSAAVVNMNIFRSRPNYVAHAFYKDSVEIPIYELQNHLPDKLQKGELPD